MSDKYRASWSSCLGMIIMFPLLIAYSSVINGLVFVQLWAWFAERWLHIATPSVPVAIGLLTIVGLFRSGLKTEELDTKFDSVKELYLYAFLRILSTAVFALVIGQIVQSFIR